MSNKLTALVPGKSYKYTKPGVKLKYGRGPSEVHYFKCTALHNTGFEVQYSKPIAGAVVHDFYFPYAGTLVEVSEEVVYQAKKRAFDKMLKNACKTKESFEAFLNGANTEEGVMKVLFTFLLVLTMVVSVGCNSGVYVLHRSGSPTSDYIAKFDALSGPYNKMNCEEFVKFVEQASPESGSVSCDPL